MANLTERLKYRISVPLNSPESSLRSQLVRCRASGEQTVLMVTGSDPMATYHFTNCVHCHKMKINVSLYRKLLFIIINVAKGAKSFPHEGCGPGGLYTV